MKQDFEGIGPLPGCSLWRLGWVERKYEAESREAPGTKWTPSIIWRRQDRSAEILLKTHGSPTKTGHHSINLTPTFRVYKSLLQGGHYIDNHTTIDVEAYSHYLRDGNGAFVVAKFYTAFIRGEAKDGRRTLNL
ncbi:hypothetical protein BDZ97DRAFT_1166626 [Flammula alnicola]|nr:hypothetical protein BDZ97DRAFT_1166626 [Flammula alnicola]